MVSSKVIQPVEVRINKIYTVLEVIRGIGVVKGVLIAEVEHDPVHIVVRSEVLDR